MKNNKTQATAPNLGRRRFLTRSGVAAIGLGAIGAGLLPPSAWAAKAVGDSASATLLRMARDIYPHDKLDDKYYAAVMTPLAQKAEQDADLRKLLKDGVADLDQRSHNRFGKPYLEIAKETDRVKVLTAMQDTPFFQKIKGDLMMGIYNNTDLFPFFGYGGSAWQHGGYINQGYGDIDWL